MRPSILGVVLLVATLAGCAEPPYTNVDNDRLKALLAQGVPIYDVRRPEEWRSTCVVEGSRTDRLARGLMERHGYTQVYNVRHGITGWLAANNPIVKN